MIIYLANMEQGQGSRMQKKTFESTTSALLQCQTGADA